MVPGVHRVAKWISTLQFTVKNIEIFDIVLIVKLQCIKWTLASTGGRHGPYPVERLL